MQSVQPAETYPREIDKDLILARRAARAQPHRQASLRPSPLASWPVPTRALLYSLSICLLVWASLLLRLAAPWVYHLDMLAHLAVYALLALAQGLGCAGARPSWRRGCCCCWPTSASS
jgi:hypothetical protein